MTQYKFDMKIGHYVVINEGEAPVENQGSQEQNQTQEKAALKNLQTEEINQLEKDKLAKLDFLNLYMTPNIQIFCKFKIKSLKLKEMKKLLSNN